MAAEYLDPLAVKKSPLFSISDSAKVIGVSRQKLNALLRDPGIKRTVITKTVNKDGFCVEKKMPPKLSLSQIEKIRQVLKERGQVGNHTNRRPEHTKKPFTIAISNLKGGVGKSQYSVLISQYLSMIGFRVLYLDSDPQGSGTASLGFHPFEYEGMPEGSFFVDDINTLEPLYCNEEPLRPVKTYWENLSIIPANIELYSAEFSLPARQLRGEGNFHDLLSMALSTEPEDWHFEFQTHDDDGAYLGKPYSPSDWDFIIFDTSPSYSYATLNALNAADALIVPVPPHTVDIISTGVHFRQMYSVFKDIRDLLDDEKTFEFILGLKSKMTNSFEAEQNGGTISAVFRETMINTPLYLSKAITVASDHGKTVYEIQGNNLIGAATLKKTIDNLELIHEEILSKVRKAWQQKKSRSLKLWLMNLKKSKEKEELNF